MKLPYGIFPPKLREYLAARECVAFVGAGFSMPCGMPAWGRLLEELLAEADKTSLDAIKKRVLRDSREAWRAGRYATAASGLRELIFPEVLRKCLNKAFDAARLNSLQDEEAKKQMLGRMENLVLGPWAGIITTNYDKLIENAFDRFVTEPSPVRCDGSQSALGNILCLPVGVGKFFVKLHGDVWADGKVLSTADYVQAWLTSRRIRHFLTAVMMQHRLVFIGCSLEDEIVRLRMGLWADFAGELPGAYALLPDTPANRLRRRELEKDAGMETLLYSMTKESPGHRALDDFLREARSCADYREPEPASADLPKLQARPLPERLVAVGAINRHLLAVLSRLDGRRLRYAYVFDPYFEQVQQGGSRHVLSTLSEGERLYRLLFLISLGLVKEVVEQDTKHLDLTPELLAHPETNPLIEGRDE